MADIQLRFHHDMLVLSAPIDYALARQGVDVHEDFEFTSLIEPEMAADALRLEALAGAHCLVTATEGICPARLAHARMEDRAADVATAALASVNANNPQHVLCEIGPCGLPLDPSSKASLKQTAQQYEAAARAFAGEGLGAGHGAGAGHETGAEHGAGAGVGKSAGSLSDGSHSGLSGASLGFGAVPSTGEGTPFDALFLNGMRTEADMRCAIEGVRKAYDGPLFASMDANEQGEFDRMTVQQVVEAMRGADVVGIRSSAAPETLCAAVRQMAQLTEAPILVQIRVKAPTAQEKKRASLGGPVPGNSYPMPDALADAALQLRAAGAQFLRACGEATPAYTGALAVAALGRDCVR